MTRLESAVVCEMPKDDGLRAAVARFGHARRAALGPDESELDLASEDDAEYVAAAIAVAERVYQLSQAVWPEVVR